MVARLGALDEAIEHAQSAPVLASEVCRHHCRTSGCPLCAGKPAPASAVEVCGCVGDCGITYDRLTLLSPGDGRVLTRELSGSVPCGTRLLILGPYPEAKAALFRATAGTWETGRGRILRPADDQMLFLPERPYLPPGTLREALAREGRESSLSDDRILATLRALNLEPVLAPVGGLDAEQRWESVLSLGEQQLVALAHILLASPRFVFLDRAGTTLGRGQLRRVMDLLAGNSVAVLAVGEAEEAPGYYTTVLELVQDGGWQWKALRAGQSETNIPPTE